MNYDLQSKNANNANNDVSILASTSDFNIHHFVNFHFRDLRKAGKSIDIVRISEYILDSLLLTLLIGRPFSNHWPGTIGEAPLGREVEIRLV